MRPLALVDTFVPYNNGVGDGQTYRVGVLPARACDWILQRMPYAWRVTALTRKNQAVVSPLVSFRIVDK